jgi:subtilase family serine protease
MSQSSGARRRTRLIAGIAAAGLAFAIPAAAAHASPSTGGGSTATAGAKPTAWPNPYHKFSQAALAIGHAPTPAAQARVMERITDYPIEVPAYDVQPLWDKGIDGSGTSIATIVSFGDPNIQAVIDAYDAHYGLPKAHVTILTPDGDVTCPPGQESTCAGWKGETDLDIEMYHTLAPGAHLYVVATPVAETLGMHGFPQMMKAIDYLIKHKTVQVISMSLAATEETFKSYDQIKTLDPTFERAKAAGIPIVTSSGDSGATGPKKGGGVYDHRVVQWPASDPLVTAAGGTQIHWTDGHRTAPDSLISLSGGGLSHAYERPSWQDSVKNITKSKMRSLPDITMEGVRGTSQSAPLFAALLALATQMNDGKPLGYLNPTLYKMGPQGKKVGIIDVTTGNNDWQGVKGYEAKKGFDIPTAYGTFDAAKFVPALVKALAAS